jgi:hypothetical protein
MNANTRELTDEKLCWLAQHTAHGRVGRLVASRKRCGSASCSQRRPSRVFQQSISVHECPSVVENLIRKIRVHSRSFAVKNLIPSVIIRVIRGENSDPWLQRPFLA